MRQSAVLLFTLLAFGLAPAAPAQQERFRDVTSVLVVEVPVQVLRDGEPVRGLTAGDFEVLDGRKRLPIVGFDVVDLRQQQGGAEGPAVAEVPISGRRHFLLLFDLSFSDPGAVVRAREAATELVLESLHPSDVVAVGTYSKARGARLVVGFTSDRRQIEYALSTLGLIQPAEGVRDPLGLMLADLQAFAEPGPSSAADRQGADASLDPATEIRELLTANETAVRRQVAVGEVVALSASLGELAGIMKAVQGRKHVVFLSEGFDSSVILGTDDQQRIQEINQAAELGQVWAIDSDERFGSTSTASDFTEMLDEFRRADCTIQAVDIGGLRAGADVRPQPSGQDGLFVMANQTGGEFYRNFNRLGEAMGKMLERTSVTYVLAVQPEVRNFDGRFHKLKVELKNGSKGVRLTHRPGYYAPLPFDQQSPIERQLAAASLVLGGAEGGWIGASILAAPFEVGRELAYVPVLVEVDGPSLLAGAGQVVPLELYAYAIDASGAVRDFFTRSLGLDVSKAGAALRQAGFKYWGHFDLPAGRYTARVVVRNSQTGASGVRSQALTVPDFDGAEAALLPPLFPEPPGRWALAREEQAAGQDTPYPFFLNGQPFIPAARPLLTAGGEAELCLMGYHLGEGALRVHGELLDPAGNPVPGVELVVDERPLTDVPGLDRMAARLRAGRLPAGEYRLVVKITNEATGGTRSSSIPVEVGG